IAAAIATGSASFEWTHRRVDNGESFSAEVDLSSLDANGSALTLAVVHDVTLRKRLDADRERALDELHELAGALVRAQDDERRRVGRELHDTTGQTLAALEMKLERVNGASAMLDARARDDIEDCLGLAEQCSTEIRTASYLLHPPLLDEIGLLSALRWLADGLRRRSGIEIELDLPHEMARLPREHELAIFRVAQEALTNVHRHSGSPSAALRVLLGADRLVLEVEDMGRGISAASGSGRLHDATAFGVGLAGMRERMRQLGGRLDVLSSGAGTIVRAELACTCIPVAPLAPA
ncbi:MAG: sensor histidine kinase, partial [Steroidobacteraceae bacterium]